MFIYMGAFVELHSEQLQRVSAIGRLRVFCAGVWHNCVLALIALASIALLPCIWIGSDSSHFSGILSPFYATSGGVVVLSVAPWSAVSSSIHPGDKIISLGAPMHNQASHLVFQMVLALLTDWTRGLAASGNKKCVKRWS